MKLPDLAEQEEKEKRPISDLDAYVAGRKRPEDGALCNDNANQVLVIIILFKSWNFRFSVT
jgi:hypothetical protein